MTVASMLKVKAVKDDELKDLNYYGIYVDGHRAGAAVKWPNDEFFTISGVAGSYSETLGAANIGDTVKLIETRLNDENEKYLIFYVINNFTVNFCIGTTFIGTMEKRGGTWSTTIPGIYKHFELTDDLQKSMMALQDEMN